MPRLSFVVPTRNRMHTALPCIRSLLAITGDFQVVVRDCSDTRDLEEQVQALADPRLTYRYAAPTSMTENWNRAFELCDGDMICYIGDDDGIVPAAKGVIEALAAQDDLAIVVSSATVVYSWPDYPDAAEAGVLAYSAPKTEISVARVSGRTAIHGSIVGLKDSPGLPRIYHGFVARAVMERIRDRTGAYFSTMNPDWFSYYMLAGVAESYHIVDCPLTITGRSGSSNTGRNIKSKTDFTHMQEYGLTRPDWDVLIPPTYTLEAHLGDGIIKALRALDDPALIDLYRRHYLPEMYARSIVRNRAKAVEIARHLHAQAYRHQPVGARARVSGAIAREIVRIVTDRVGSRLRRGATSPNTLVRVHSVPDIIAAIARFEDGNPMLRDIAAGVAQPVLKPAAQAGSASANPG